MKSVLFVCIGNSCRSPMAEGYALKYGENRISVFSAGTDASERLHPYAMEVMKEEEIDISGQSSKPLEQFRRDMFDFVILMGSDVKCGALPGKNIRNWNIDDPFGGTLDDYRHARDRIKQKVFELIDEINGK